MSVSSKNYMRPHYHERVVNPAEMQQDFKERMSNQESETHPGFEDGIIDHTTMNKAHAGQRVSTQQQQSVDGNTEYKRMDTNNPPTALQFAGGRSELEQDCPLTPQDQDPRGENVTMRVPIPEDH